MTPTQLSKRKLEAEGYQVAITEHWNPVVGYEGIYEVSSLGKIKSLDRIDSSGHKRKGKQKSVCFDHDGYSVVGLCRQGKLKQFGVHRLVAIAFIENKENLPQVNHMDGNKNNNSVGNLEWVTCAENRHHAKLNGLTALGEKNGNAKINTDLVVLIKRLYAEGKRQTQISRETGINRSCVNHIVRGRSWLHVE